MLLKRSESIVTVMIREGDPVTVIVKSRGRLREYYFKARRDTTYMTVAGPILGSELVGAKYGSSLQLPGGLAYVLPPTPREKIEGFYERETQVIYRRDAWLIVDEAGLERGKRVLEGGVGSGFLTTVLALSVCPDGRVYGYDIKKSSIEVTRRNIEKYMGHLAQCVELKEGDVRKGVAEKDLDAAVLDIPEPWEALDSLWDALKEGSPLVVFVPSMNQLIKIVEAVSDSDRWILLRAIETDEREISIEKGAVRPGKAVPFMGYVVSLRKVNP